VAVRILVVDDDRAVRESLRRSLSFNGYSVELAHDGVEALDKISHDRPDALVLDVMMPRLDGLEVCRHLRSTGDDLPILVLTARDSVSDRVKGLDLGADDYLVKPYAFTELLARIRALLRRRAERQADILQVADLRIDLLGHKAYRGGVRLDLAPKEFALLSLLARHQGEVLCRRRIAEQVWDMNFDCDSNVVDVAVRRLRRKIDDSFIPELIHTVRGMGYVLETR